MKYVLIAFLWGGNPGGPVNIGTFKELTKCQSAGEAFRALSKGDIRIYYYCVPKDED